MRSTAGCLLRQSVLHISPATRRRQITGLVPGEMRARLTLKCKICPGRKCLKRRKHRRRVGKYTMRGAGGTSKVANNQDPKVKQEGISKRKRAGKTADSQRAGDSGSQRGKPTLLVTSLHCNVISQTSPKEKISR